MDASQSITTELLEKILRSAEKNNDVKVESFQIEEGCKHGDNHLCEMFAINVKAAKNDEKKTYNLVAKCSPDNELRQEWLNKGNLFQKEVKVYTDLIPKMIKFQETLGIEPLIPSAPKYYYSYADGKNDVLIMENLKTHGYIVLDRKKGVDFQHSKLVMKELAKFHALSFAMKQTYTEPLVQQFPYLEEAVVSEEFSDFMSVWDDGYKSLVQLARSNPDYTQYASRMENFNVEYLASLQKSLEPKEPFAGICHGDCWFSNVMFSYENDGKSDIPNSVKLVDFQIVRYTTFAIDLAYFFYTSTTPTLRKNHLDDLLKLYHTSFLEYIHHLDIEAPTYPFQKLKSDFHDSMAFGFLFACALLPPMLCDPKNAPDLESITEEGREAFFDEWNRSMIEEINRSPSMKERVLGMIAEMAEKGIF